MKKPDFTTMGAVVAGVFSATCCLGPALFAGLGISVGVTGLLAGVAGFVKFLTPYRPFFIVIAFGFLTLAFWKVYRSGPMACCVAENKNGANTLKRQKIVLWIASAVTVILILSPYWL